MEAAVHPLEPKALQLKHHIIIVGGGATGIAVAAEFKRPRRDLDIAVAEPSETHSYQPGRDAVSTANAQTAAAVRLQSSVVANLLSACDGKSFPKAYDGYGSCPLTVAIGKIKGSTIDSKHRERGW